MPAKSAKQYGLMQGVAHGNIKGIMPMSVAKEFIDKTSPKKRKTFARVLANKK